MRRSRFEWNSFRQRQNLRDLIRVPFANIPIVSGSSRTVAKELKTVQLCELGDGELFFLWRDPHRNDLAPHLAGYTEACLRGDQQV